MKKLLLALNKCFKPVVHPFNLNNDGIKTYAEWQFEKGNETIKNYLRFSDAKTMFEGKDILDIGCGAGGKSLYYVTLGANHVYGVDCVEHYKEESEALAEKKGLSEKFTFIHADAKNLPYPDESFDTVIMNDAMEHVAEPEAVLCEILRVMKKGGRIYINFPPYHHPFGAHLSDAVNIPWVHLFFTEKTLIEAYKELVKDKPDGESRIEFRISEKDGKEYFSYINKMTLRRFSRIKKNLNLNCVYYEEMPLRSFLKPLAKIPVLKEMFVKMAVCVVEK
jgi:ubiquinone/menaquinone biosynthesis C-methylase UbiE